jgi:hypothetical protein
MLDAKYLGLIRNAATVASVSLFLSGCLLQEELAEEAEASAAAALEDDFELSGSVGDGPVVGAAMRVVQNDGVILDEFQSDAAAGYNITVRTKGKYYPLLVDARGGTDLVTNQAPDFVLIGTALEPSKKYVVNLNPFSTLAMEIARDLPGGASKANVYAALEILSSALDFGLVSFTATGPMSAKIDSSNVAEIVKASEAVGEVVRRTRDWLLTAGFVWNGDDVVGALGSDLLDGVIDGNGGPRSDARLAAIANIVIAQVLLESTGNELHVNGADATASLEMAIQEMNLGTASPALGELTATSGMLSHIDIGLSAADAISDDTRVTDLKTSASGLQPGLQPALARSILPPDYRQTLDDAVLLLLGNDWDSIATVNDVVRDGSGVTSITPPPDEDPPAGNTAPVISGTPTAVVTVNNSYNFTPTASDADGHPLTFSVAGLPAWAQFSESNGQISGTPGDAHVGTHSGIVITVSDGQDTSDLGPFSVTVEAISLGSATLTWQPPTQYEDGTSLTPPDFAGYKIYWGTTPGSYPNSVTLNNPGLTTYVVDNLAPGTYEFVATAFNAAGVESRFSNAMSKTVP